MSSYYGMGPEGIPSNDPEQRGDADGDGARPDVNREGFDPKYEAMVASGGKSTRGPMPSASGGRYTPPLD